MAFISRSLYSSLKKKYALIVITAIFLLIPAASAQQDVSCYHCHTPVVTEFRNNVHYKIGFTCADCHGGSIETNASVISYNVMSGNFIGRPTRLNVTMVCEKCHIEETKNYKQSIHWEQIEKGHLEAATCTDCHGIHEIRAIKDPKSPSNHQNSPATCAKCHSNTELMSAWYYGIKTDRFDTYKESFHWKALRNGYNVVATCADCHENHLTKAHTDPASSTYPANLPMTCGQTDCHPGVKFDAKIAAGLVHDKESLHSGDLLFNKTGMNPQIAAYYLGPFDLAYWIAIFFKILTTSVIGIFAGMVILDFVSRFKMQKRW